MAAFGARASTSVTAERTLIQSGTLPAREQTTSAEQESPEILSPVFFGTQPRVNRLEKGDELKTDESLAFDVDDLGALGVQELIKSRQALAGQLSELVAKARKNQGKIAMAADTQLLKRGLSRAHEVLGKSKSESNYLSIITLVEACLASMDWKAADDQQLHQIQNALEVGRDRAVVTFDDYNKLERLLRGYGLSTVPRFDFSAEEDGYTEDVETSEPE